MPREPMREDGIQSLGSGEERVGKLVSRASPSRIKFSKERKVQRIFRVAAMTLCFVAAYAANAQQPPKPAQKAVPTIPAELKAKFFKAQSWMQSAQIALDRAQQDLKAKQDAFTATIEEVKKACEPDFTAGLNSDGDPICQPKASAPKEPPAPAKK